MPFVSRSQLRACHAAKDPNWNCHLWAKHTKNMKKLPEHKKKAELLAAAANLPHWQAYLKSADEQGPPNYRPADPLGPSCQRCKFFTTDGSTCQKYATQVEPSYTCDAFQGQELDTNAILNQVPDPMPIPEETPAPAQPALQFKAAFLLRCLEQGMGPEEIEKQANAACEALEKRAGVINDYVMPFANTYGNVATAALLGAPLAAGYVGGKVVGKVHNDLEANDTEALKTENRVMQYRQLAAQAALQAKLRKLQEANPGKIVQLS